MRVLYLTAGNIVHDSRFLKKMSETGYEVHYLPIFQSGIVPHLPGVTIHLLGPKSQPRTVSILQLLTYLRVFARFLRILRRVRPDVLHAGFVQSCGLMAAASGFHPFVLSPMGSDIFVYPQRSSILKKITQYVLRQTDVVTCDSRTLLRHVLALSAPGHHSVEELTWGVDPRLFRPDPGERSITRQELMCENAKLVVMTRNFHPVYGVSDFIASLPHVIGSIPEARFLLIGDGPLRQELEAQVKESSLQTKVRFLGHIANKEMPRFLNAADLYVSSSFSDSTSVSLLEAMACGLPVVVTDVPTNFEWVRPGVGGLVVPKSSPAELGEAIVRIFALTDADRQQMGDSNRRIVEDRADW